MTDKAFIEMSSLLDSITELADTLRVVFETVTVVDLDTAIKTGGSIIFKEVSTDRAKAHPEYKHRRFMRFDRDLETLASIIKNCNCDDWTTNKFKAGEIYRRMRAFVSATEEMPKGISWPFKKVRTLCETPMKLIPGTYPDLADLPARAADEVATPVKSADGAEVKCDSKTKRKDTIERKRAEKIETFKRDFFNHPAVIAELDKGDDSRIELKDQQIIWKRSLRSLCWWLIDEKIIIGGWNKKDEHYYKWSYADNVFTWKEDGKLISKDRLALTWKTTKD